MTNSFTGFEVRRMTEADLDQVIEIAGSLPEAPHWPRSAYQTALDPMASPPRIALVAENTHIDTTVGFAIASLIPPQAELEMIAIAADFQGRGCAKQLFSSLTQQLRPTGAVELILEVRASNHRAIGLYRNLGFAESGRRSGYYIDPVEDAVLMGIHL
ncbi:MAG: ribosomal protein S18-alanine N-acetyltransferase [Terracidiphilus sp.]|jgi:ribosomal-protein-alanine N-acetyltransferase